MAPKDASRLAPAASFYNQRGTGSKVPRTTRSGVLLNRDADSTHTPDPRYVESSPEPSPEPVAGPSHTKRRCPILVEVDSSPEPTPASSSRSTDGGQGSPSEEMKVTKKTGPGGTDSGIKHVCDRCTLDVTNTVFIRCAEPICKKYELCIECFAVKPERHKDHDPQTHGFQVIEPNARPIFVSDWGADEELRLIEGMEKYGVGSWADIASHIGGFRTKEECEKHYVQTYIESPNFPLPERADINDMTLTESISKEEFQANRKARIANAKEENEKAAAASTGPKQKPTASVPACHEVQGFMPGRLEFETEYANEAEEVIQGMSFEPGDGVNQLTGELEPEAMLKHDVLAIYNDRLDQRAERKRVIFEHDLLDYRKKIAEEKKLPKEERDIVNRCKPFAQLMNHEEYEEFVALQRKIHGLKAAIAQLQEWRRMGVTSLEDGEAYEKAKAERAARQAHAQQGQFDRLPNAGRPKPQPVPEQPSLAQTLVAPKLPHALDQVLSGRAPKISAKEFIEAHDMTQALQAANILPADLNNIAPAVDSGYRCQPIKDIVPWEMGRDVPDIQLLLKEEISLCNVCHIRPKPYFVIKQGMLQEAMRLGGNMKKKDAKALLPNLDPQKVSRIYDFFIRAGWIGKA